MKPKRLPKLHENDIIRFWTKVDRRGIDECWSWLASCKSDGRGGFTIGKRCENSHRCLQAPRVAYALHFDTDPFPQQVLHTCNNANCVNPNHLYLGDDLDNRSDSVEAGTHYHGSRHHKAKLNETSVKLIQKALIQGERLYILADRFDVCIKTISNIRRGKVWKHIKVDGFKPFTSHGNTRSKQ